MCICMCMCIFLVRSASLYVNTTLCFCAAGATAVCIVCYVIPVALHLKIYSCGSYAEEDGKEFGGLHVPLLQVRKQVLSPCASVILPITAHSGLVYCM